MTADASIVVVEDDVRDADVIEPDQETYELGQWFWIEGEDDEEWLGCVTHVGSNHVKMTSVEGGYRLILFTQMVDRARREHDADNYIMGQVLRCEAETKRLMGEIAELTARLGCLPAAALASGSETRALSIVSGGGADMKSYKADLVKAKTETLPKLFEAVKKSNREMSTWLTATTLPIQAQAESMNNVIGRIDDRILSVRLYAGLNEDVEKIKDGEPAPLTTKIHLLQRRCYMDEECLAQYEAGGMEFKDLRAFEAWFLREENLARLLPFERCVVAFRVRRHEKERPSYGSFVTLFEILEKIRADQYTFLYIRNGEQVFRMYTEIEFGPTLFPDMSIGPSNGKRYARKNIYGQKDVIISEDEYLSRCQEHDRRKAEYDLARQSYDVAIKAYKRAEEDAKVSGVKFDAERPDCVMFFSHDDPRRDYAPFEPSNVHFDATKEILDKQAQEHNRIVLILQGLLDRSPVFAPHPPWKLYNQDSFHQALELVYDDSRTLPAGDKPDFEAYMAKLGESIQEGSVTIGQFHHWREEQIDAWNKYHGYRDRDRWHADGNPGPGRLAKVESFSPRTRMAKFSWNRERSWRSGEGDPIRCTHSAPASVLFNADAYKPGDFRQFFNDPRTRAEYLKWAPLLLEAEEYHAGNRKILPPVPAKPKAPTTLSAKRAYARRKLCKSLVGKTVTNTRTIQTSSKVYKAGLTWEVTDTCRGGVNIQLVLPEGSTDTRAFVSGVDPERYLTLVDTPPKSLQGKTSVIMLVVKLLEAERYEYKTSCETVSNVSKGGDQPVPPEKGWRLFSVNVVANSGMVIYTWERQLP